ncbi:MAG: hypothetical protein M3487_12840 [Actinomycetota bacterium]|nr:hypothetical protein [Actinomycetota bacterium]
MSDLTPAAQRWLARHHGVITTPILRRCGVGRTTRERLLRTGVLCPASKGIFILASAPRSLEQRAGALCAAHPSGFVTGPTAGSMLGLRRMPKSAAIHFAIRHGARVDGVVGVKFRQTTALDEHDRRRRDDGITVPSWSRLAFDLAADLRELDLISVLNQLLHERKVTSEELVAIERRLGHPARPGSGRFRRAIERLDGRAPHESHPEVRVAAGLRARNVPIEAQTVVSRPNGRTARIDLAVPSVRWGVELDIHPEHATVEGRANDVRRLRDLHRATWQIETVVEGDLKDIDGLCVELARLYRARVQALGGNHPGVS